MITDEELLRFAESVRRRLMLRYVLRGIVGGCFGAGFAQCVSHSLWWVAVLLGVGFVAHLWSLRVQP